MVFGMLNAKLAQTYDDQATPSSEKPALEKPARKIRKGVAETSRLFIDVDEMIRIRRSR